MPIIRISEVDSGLCTLKIIKISIAWVVSYLPINYSVSYTPILTPKTIFIPANHDGSYQGEELEIEKNLTTINTKYGNIIFNKCNNAAENLKKALDEVYKDFTPEYMKFKVMGKPKLRF